MSRDEERADLDTPSRLLDLVGRPGPRLVRPLVPERADRERLAAADRGLVYDSDPSTTSCRTTEVEGRRWLVVPYSKVHNDTRYFLAPTYATPRHFAET